MGASVKEVLRWMVTAPLSLPYRQAKVDCYMFYFLPKEATALANVFEISRGPLIHPECVPSRALYSLLPLKIESKKVESVDQNSFKDEELITCCSNFPCGFTWRD